MDDSRAVRFVERVGDLDRVVKGLVQRQRAPRQAIGEGFTLEQLHHDEVGTAVVPDVVERTDVRMVQRGDGARFSLKALTQLRVRCHLGGEHLDRNHPVEPRVARAIHLAHPARAEGGNDLVRAQSDSGSQQGSVLNTESSTITWRIIRPGPSFSAR